MFIEFRTAPNLALMTEKYEQRKAAGKNRMNIQKSEIAGYPVYLILFKQRTYCYAQLSGTRWIAGEKETVSLALDLNEVDSLKANEVFVEEMESNKSSLMFSLHDPKGNVEIAHPSFKTYKGHYSKLSYSDDFVYDFSLSMDNQVDLQGVESFIRMMSNFAFAKPELKMSAENIITSLTDGNLDISVRASAENIKSIFAHMKSKWAKKRSYNKSKACTEKKCDKSDLLIQ
jgi:hypothetical protein